MAVVLDVPVSLMSASHCWSDNSSRYLNNRHQDNAVDAPTSFSDTAVRTTNSVTSTAGNRLSSRALCAPSSSQSGAGTRW